MASAVNKPDAAEHDDPIAFVNELATYYMDFLETDFHPTARRLLMSTLPIGFLPVCESYIRIIGLFTPKSTTPGLEPACPRNHRHRKNSVRLPGGDR